MMYDIKIWTDLTSVMSQYTQVTHRRTDGHLSHRWSALAFHEARKKINDKKTSKFITQCDISHAFQTAKNIVFDLIMYKSPDVPLQDELLC